MRYFASDPRIRCLIETLVVCDSLTKIDVRLKSLTITV
jgi:hypothetical protein